MILLDSSGQPTGLPTNPISISIENNSLSSSIDAFGRIRISEISTLFDTVHQYDNSPLFWDTIIVGSGSISHVANQSSVQLSVGNTTGDSVKFQTRQYHRYQPGKSQIVLSTGLLGSSVTNVVKRAGYFDDSDGIFFEVSSSDIAWVIRSNTSGTPVNNRIVQSSWNLDTLDGSGSYKNPSSIALDTTKVQLMVIDFQWLSIGIVRVGFQINGKTIFVHIFKHSNILTTPYMATANLPIRFELTNTGATSGTNTLLSICSVVASEGGQQQFGLPFSANNGSTAKSVTAALIPLLSLSLKTTFQSITNRGIIDPSEFGILSDQSVLIEIWANAVLTGASWTDVDTTNSISQVDVASSAMTGGQRIYSALVSSGTGRSLALETADLNFGKRKLSLNAAGNSSDILTIAGSKLTTNASVYSSLNWVEIR